MCIRDSYGIDPTKIKNDLGWYPETPFEKGIVLTIDWYLDHEEWMEHITSGNYQKYYEEMYKNKYLLVNGLKAKKSRACGPMAARPALFCRS